MKRAIVTISESGIVTIPNVPTASILMRDFEIAQLFGVYGQTVKANIKVILKSGVVVPDYIHGGTVVGNSIQPDYFGLDMITAIAFRVDSPNAQAFRKMVLSELGTVGKPASVSLVIQVDTQKQPHRLTN